MRKKAIKGAWIGLCFAGIGLFAVNILGFNQTSFLLMEYLFVLMGVFMSLPLDKSFLSSRLKFLDRIVLVAEEEELKMKKLFSGEKYKIKGKVEKVQ